MSFIKNYAKNTYMSVFCPVIEKTYTEALKTVKKVSR
jgi:hypothetical protein